VFEQLVKPIFFGEVAQAERRSHSYSQENKLLRASLVNYKFPLTAIIFTSMSV
jgi:hypothetical protein